MPARLASTPVYAGRASRVALRSQYNLGGTSLGGVSANGLVLANSSAAPTIVPLYGTEGYIPTITNTGVNGDAVPFGSAGLVDSGYVPENVAYQDSRRSGPSHHSVPVLTEKPWDGTKRSSSIMAEVQRAGRHTPEK